MAMQTRGAVIDSWSHFDPFHIFGVKPATASPAGGAAMTGMPGLELSAGPSLAEAGTAKPWHPDSPLFWFGVLAATTLGLIGASTSLRVGPFKAAVAAGKT